MGFKDEPADGRAWRRNTVASRRKEPDRMTDDELAAEAEEDMQETLRRDAIPGQYAENRLIDFLFEDDSWNDRRPDFWRQFYDELLMTELGPDDAPDEFPEE